MPAHGLDTCAQLLCLMLFQRQRGQQPLGRVAVRVRCSTFKLLDAVDTQTCALSERFLRQARRDALLPQQSAKLRSRIARHPFTLKRSSRLLDV